MNKSITDKNAIDLNRLLPTVDYMFKQLSNKAGRTLTFEEEMFWKKAFTENIIFKIDEFFEEMGSEANIIYNSPIFIKDLKDFHENT